MGIGRLELTGFLYFCCMYLVQIELLNFKNHADVSLRLSPGINCFYGANGTGKTNLLDAVYYLSMCKSYLNPLDRQNIGFGQQFFMIQGEWSREEENIWIQCSVKVGSKKLVKRNKKEYERLSDHIGQFPVVMVSPYDRDLISEGSEWRRKWMDGIICQFNKDYLLDLQSYMRVLEQRNAFLKQLSVVGAIDRDSMDIWNEQMILLGNRIHLVRKNFLEEFKPVFQRYFSLFGGENEQVDLLYKSQLSDADFAELLRLSERKDIITQYSSTGIHKDDLLFELDNHPIKKFGSQGQQKTYLTALRLAQYDWLRKNLRVNPVLMLDDIFDKLDAGRVSRLIELVKTESFGQVWITDTDEYRLKQLFDGDVANVAYFSVTPDEVLAQP
jgi:DNA replication and repair protein RecF